MNIGHIQARSVPVFEQLKVEEKKALPWYGVRTASKREQIVAIRLATRGYEHYLPMYHTRRRWSDRVVSKKVPLFPGYVFCRFDYMKRLPIMVTPGVVSIVSFGRDPAPIPDNEIAGIQTVLQSGLAAEPCPFLQEGQRVRVIHGSLKNVSGILVKRKSDSRLVVSISMLQRSVSVELDGDCIAAA